MAEHHQKRRYGVDTAQRFQKGFFFNQSVYALYQYWGKFETYKCSLDVHGAANRPVYVTSTPSGDSRGILAACTFRGQCYLFYDEAVGAGFKVMYKVTNDPDAGWSPNGIDTGLRGEYTTWGARGSAPSLEVIEFQDYLWVFYGKTSLIYAARFDGKTWQQINGNGPYILSAANPTYAVCTATVGTTPYLIFGWVKEQQKTDVQLSFITPDGTIAFQREVYCDWGRGDDVFRITNGSIPGGPQGNMLQLFVNNSGSIRYDLRRTSLNLDTWELADYVDTDIESQAAGPLGAGFNHFDVVPTAAPTGTGIDFRRCLQVLAFDSGGVMGEGTHVLASYQSDYFRCDVNPNAPNVYVLDTADARTHYPETYTLLGVIEGVPPFTRNSIGGTDTTSSVTYSESKSSTRRTTQGFEASLMMSAGMGQESLWDVSAEFAATFGVATEMYKTVTHSFDVALTNKDNNAEGDHGYMIVSRPKFRAGRFTRCSYDGKVELARFFLTVVDGVSHAYIRYKLSDPPKGMRTRPRSSALTEWMSDVPSGFAGVHVHQLETIEWSFDGGSITPSLTIAAGETHSSSGSVSVTLKDSATFKELFKFESSAAFTFSYGTDLTFEFAQSASIGYQIPFDDDPDAVAWVEIRPYWFIPADDAFYDPATSPARPFWLPDEFVNAKMIPWCLTWKVLNVQYGWEAEQASR